MESLVLTSDEAVGEQDVGEEERGSRRFSRRSPTTRRSRDWFADHRVGAHRKVPEGGEPRSSVLASVVAEAVRCWAVRIILGQSSHHGRRAPARLRPLPLHGAELNVVPRRRAPEPAR